MKKRLYQDSLSKYMVSYALNDTKGVHKLLRDRYFISERRYKGDTAASDILIDLNHAIEIADLSPRQTEAVALVYGYWQLTQSEAAEVMGISQKQVNKHIKEAVKKIADIFKQWNYGEIDLYLMPQTEVETVESEVMSVAEHRSVVYGTDKRD